jgi:hypothetical protein
MCRQVDVVDFSNRTPLLAQPAVPYLLDSSTPILNIEKSEVPLLSHRLICICEIISELLGI